MSTDSSLYDQLRAAILNGEFRQPSALVEAALAKMYGVSRTPVREALQRLEQDGIVQRTGRQIRVRVTTAEEVLEVYDCRVVLEGMAARWAARNRTDFDVAMLERALSRMAEPEPRTPAEMARVNRVFHDRLWKASHNETLCDLLDRLEVQTRRYPEPTISQPGRWEQAVHEHGEILDAIRDRDEDKAAGFSSAHMAVARDLRLEMIQGAEGL